MELNFPRLIIDLEPCNVQFLSEPYPVLLKTGFTVAADVLLKKGMKKSEMSLLISAQSIAVVLKEKISDNSGKLSGIQLWIYKSGAERNSKYVLEE